MEGQGVKNENIEVKIMAKYKIAWLEGDGVGKDVMGAAKIVLDALGLDAEYIKGDVGWEFWKKEGNPLPDRTIDILKETNCSAILIRRRMVRGPCCCGDRQPGIISLTSHQYRGKLCGLCRNSEQYRLA